MGNGNPQSRGGKGTIADVVIGAVGRPRKQVKGKSRAEGIKKEQKKRRRTGDGIKQ